MRLAGSLLILTGGCLGLCLQLREQCRREETLREMIRGLRWMAEEIRLARTSLPGLLQALSKSTGGDTGRFFSAVAASVREGESPESVWRREIAHLSLFPEEKRVLQEMEFLGDEEKICSGIILSTERLSRLGEERRQSTSIEVKRRAALWGSGTALLLILLI